MTHSLVIDIGDYPSGDSCIQVLLGDKLDVTDVGWCVPGWFTVFLLETWGESE